MALQLMYTAEGPLLNAGELSLLRHTAKAHGRATLLVSDASQRDAHRRCLADASCALGIEVSTPQAWLASLWELAGDGRRIVGGFERRMLMADIIAGRPAEELAPLRANPGTVRLLACMASELLPYVDVASASSASSAHEEPGNAGEAVFSLLRAYARRLEELGMVEASQAAECLAALFDDEVPACARWVALRDVDDIPAYLLRLLATLARKGTVVMLLSSRGDMGALLRERFSRMGCAVEEAPVAPDGSCPCDGVSGGSLDTVSSGEAAGVGVADMGDEEKDGWALSFLEVEGPHARVRAYADEVARLLMPSRPGVSDAASREAVVVCRRPAEAFDALAPALAARGVASRVTRTVRFDQTAVGRQFTVLSDMTRRLQAAQAGEVSATEWWPAPELTDWLYCPLAGVDATFARAFDKRLRSTRALSVEAVLRELQSVQSRVEAARRKLDEGHPYAQVPAVCSDVLQFLMQGRPVSALKAMHEVAVALPTAAFGSADGTVRVARERAMALKAIEALTVTARELGVSQAVAATVLEGLAVRSAEEGGAGEAVGATGTATFLTLDEAAALAPASSAAVFFADVDVESYPLAHEEGPLATLREELGRERTACEPASRLRTLFARAAAAASEAVTMARVTHDRQAKDRYPAAIWTEWRAASDAPAAASVDEGDVVRDFHALAEGARLETERVSCLPPQELNAAAMPYVVLKRRNEAGTLVPRQFSASQIESYASCPLCWFVSSRVRPASIDAGFGNMEKGNFVHDVMERFHKGLLDEGGVRVTNANIEDALVRLREVFATVRAEHARGKTSSSAPLVPLSAVEERQVDDILPQLEKVVRYEAGALAPFVPAYLEYSFNGLGVDYAGWPLGGRIDRVDVDAEGRAVIIDYKHRSDVNAFKLKDPTVPNAKTGVRPADDPRWLPEHTQALIYAQALRRALGLDVRGALYFATKGKVSMRGAISAELAEVEPGDGRVPGLRDGFPGEDAGGTMTFEELLARVEAQVGERLEDLARGELHAAAHPQGRCSYNHALGFERRDA